ncbi:nitric oxide reductase NorE protein [Nocardioides sp. J9]|uniref:cytochrome c oxidase subunit 3 n=1 Tax=Nocardioides sp. J9 TaxID=935844 RepID=UPI0011A57E72|nr:cytochrome c oxidase subunit 3 [Nocardioides sp. J9]TWG94932.1 nitric oxide reductase NorE protein [Nocardioides sp. J9]
MTAHVQAAPSRRPVPVDLGFWCFVLGDMSVFAMFFGAYLWELGEDRPGFAAEAAHLVVALGLINTMVLLASSYVVARAVAAQRRGDDARARQLVGWALAGGALFATVKLVEYTLEISNGHAITSSTFFGYYFVLTGLHLMHVAIGSILLVSWRWGLAQGRVSMRWAEAAAGYWHMVDLLWLVIFSILYIGTHA